MGSPKLQMTWTLKTPGRPNSPSKVHFSYSKLTWRTPSIKTNYRNISPVYTALVILFNCSFFKIEQKSTLCPLCLLFDINWGLASFSKWTVFKNNVIKCCPKISYFYWFCEKVRSKWRGLKINPIGIFQIMMIWIE